MPKTESFVKLSATYTLLVVLYSPLTLCVVDGLNIQK